MSKKHANASLFDRKIAFEAIEQAFVKLSPRLLARNPVIFVTAIVAALVTAMWLRDLIAGNGGNTVNFGSPLDATTKTGRGGSISNIDIAGNIGSVGPNVAILAYNDIFTGQSVADFVTATLVNGASTALNDALGNVGLVAGATGRVKDRATGTIDDVATSGAVDAAISGRGSLGGSLGQTSAGAAGSLQGGVAGGALGGLHRK